MSDMYDVIVVGGGIGGLYTILNLPRDKKILLMCKKEIMLCNTALAQGGVAAVLDKLNDNFDLHFNDTMIAGRQENNPEAVKVLVEEGPSDVLNIYHMGVDFDLNKDGGLLYTLEGGHSRNRIVHHRDSTGDEIEKVLSKRVLELDNVTVMENCQMFDLDRIRGGFAVSYLDENEQAKRAYSPYVVFATGGIGQVYRYTTNSAIATGDGIRIAFENGCRIKHLSYVQFHPTAFAGTADRQRFLISEAVRGEGAYLLNCNGERFMHLYDERLELAPRDVVSKSIILESRRVASDKFYLDIAYKGADFLKNRFPQIYGKCLEAGVDITKDKIPIYPCQHYLMGGIDVDLHAGTTLDGLYAVGECSHTGVHGHNRLASNSLLEALVFGRRAAQDICSKGFKSVPEPDSSRNPLPDMSGAPLPEGLDFRINDILQRSCFVVPDYDAMRKGARQVKDILDRLYTGSFAKTKRYYDVLSIATVAHIIMKEMLSAK